MATIKCATEGCLAALEIPRAVETTKYSCRLHTETNEDSVRFQKHQFDKDMRRSGSPAGTSHIRNQGSDVTTSEDFTCPKCEGITRDGICEC